MRRGQLPPRCFLCEASQVLMNMELGPALQRGFLWGSFAARPRRCRTWRKIFRKQAGLTIAAPRLACARLNIRLPPSFDVRGCLLRAQADSNANRADPSCREHAWWSEEQTQEYIRWAEHQTI